MTAVIFEVHPKPGRAQRYFDLAAQMKPMLQGIDGFVSVERFQSLTTEGKFLSLSLWRDEEAVRAPGARTWGTGRGSRRVAATCSPTTGSASLRCCATTA
jgi:hypothetical protein